MKGIFNLLFLTTFCFNVISGNSILQELSKLNQYSQVSFFWYVVDYNTNNIMFSLPTS